MPKVLAVVDWYLPGYKGGGPVVSVSNLIESIGSDDCTFYVVTRDRDVNDRAPYLDLPVDSWVSVGNAKVYYSSDPSLFNVCRLIKDLVPDVVYLNSFFSRLTIQVLAARRLGLIPRSATILAPRGELSSGALSLKEQRKKFFMFLAGRCGLYRRILWQASTIYEKEDIEKAFLQLRDLGCIHIASDIPNIGAEGRQRQKEPGEARFVFLSRISPKKNLLAAIELVSELEGRVILDIYGPAEDPRYFEQCKQAIVKTPENVKVNYRGSLPYEQARSKYNEYHFFLFPTLGENFGHVILEALGTGCPAIISDQTPWHNLQAHGVGWTLPLEDREIWKQVLQRCVEMDQATYLEMSTRANVFARAAFDMPAILEENRNLFRKALTMPGDRERPGNTISQGSAQ